MALLRLYRRRRTLFFFLVLGPSLWSFAFVAYQSDQLNNVNDSELDLFVTGTKSHSSNQRMRDPDLLNSNSMVNHKEKEKNQKSQDVNFNVKNANQNLQYKKYKFQDGNREENNLPKDQISQNSIGEDYNIDNGKKKNKYNKTIMEERRFQTVSYNQNTPTETDKHAQLLDISRIVIDGIYWSQPVENLIPKGFSKNDIEENIKSLSGSHVEVLEPALLQKCGRPKNAYVMMSDGTQACARYRHPDDKYLVGDVLSFYLSRLIRLDNVPAVVLSRVTNSSTQWRGTPFKTLEWEEGRIIPLVQWINDSRVPEKMPKLILMALEKNLTIDGKMIAEAAKSEKQLQRFLSNMAQWGSMIIFDYLTATHDRVAFMQAYAEKTSMQTAMQYNVRNLCKSDAGKLWLIDNECGLLEAYGFIYSSFSDIHHVYGRYHRSMLRTMCIFQKPIVAALKELHNNTSPHTVLEQYARNHEALLDEVPINNRLHRLFVLHFHERLQEVMDWITFCETSK